jgi:type IV pilus assembly protein PilV
VLSNCPRASRITGSTLVEVLVSLVVLSIGLLGVAALQLSSLRANSSAAQRSQATFLAYDIADRMRANRNAALAGAYNIGYDDPASASPNPLARKDLDEWKTRIQKTFPRSSAGAAKSRIERIGDDRFSISIQWNDSRGDGDLGKDDTLIVFTTQTQI